jgi:excisionase family DNA binding protein
MSEAAVKNSHELQPQSESAFHCDDLRLLTLNEARKLLGIRTETLKKLVSDGKIGVIMLEGKVKIPFLSLKKYIQDSITFLNKKSDKTIEEDINEIIKNLSRS